MTDDIGRKLLYIGGDDARFTYVSETGSKVIYEMWKKRRGTVFIVHIPDSAEDEFNLKDLIEVEVIENA